MACDGSCLGAEEDVCWSGCSTCLGHLERKGTGKVIFLVNTAEDVWHVIDAGCQHCTLINSTWASSCDVMSDVGSIM